MLVVVCVGWREKGRHDQGTTPDTRNENRGCRTILFGRVVTGVLVGLNGFSGLRGLVRTEPGFYSFADRRCQNRTLDIGRENPQWGTGRE